MNAREVRTPVSCVTVGGGGEVGSGEVESPGAGGEEGGGGDDEVVMGK